MRSNWIFAFLSQNRTSLAQATDSPRDCQKLDLIRKSFETISSLFLLFLLFLYIYISMMIMEYMPWIHSKQFKIKT